MHHTRTCAPHTHMHTTRVHAHYTSTCALHRYMCTTRVHAHYTSTCTLHGYMHTTWVHAHYTSTCALHRYMCTTWVHAHYTSTCTLHGYMHTTWIHVHYMDTCALHGYMCTACVRPCIIPLVTQDTNTRWITCDRVIVQPQWSRVIVLNWIVHFIFQVKMQKHSMSSKLNTVLRWQIDCEALWSGLWIMFPCVEIIHTPCRGEGYKPCQLACVSSVLSVMQVSRFHLNTMSARAQCSICTCSVEGIPSLICLHMPSHSPHYCPQTKF